MEMSLKSYNDELSVKNYAFGIGRFRVIFSRPAEIYVSVSSYIYRTLNLYCILFFVCVCCDIISLTLGDSTPS